MLRYLRLVWLGALLIGTLAPFASAQNLLTNGNFESGAAGWTVWDKPPAIYYEDFTHYFGAGATVHLPMPHPYGGSGTSHGQDMGGNNAHGGIFQVVNVVPGRWFRVSGVWSGGVGHFPAAGLQPWVWWEAVVLDGDITDPAVIDAAPGPDDVIIAKVERPDFTGEEIWNWESFGGTFRARSDRATFALKTGKVGEWTYLAAFHDDLSIRPALYSLWRTPSDGSANRPVNLSVRTVFSDRIDPATLTTATFTLEKLDQPGAAAGTPVAAAVSYTAASREAALTPAADLAANTYYRARLAASIADADGFPAGDPSEWTFQTGSGPDSDGDGVPDSDDDAPLDATQVTLSSATGAGPIVIDVSSEPGVEIRDAHAVAEPTDPAGTTGKPSGYGFPYGLISFQLNGVTPGDTVQVRLILPASLPWTSRYYKVSAADGYSAVPLADAVVQGTTVFLSLTDGGSGDADRRADGVIRDPGGVATPSGAVGGSGGSGGCFLSTARGR